MGPIQERVGWQQGCPGGPAFYCAFLLPTMRWLKQELTREMRQEGQAMWVRGCEAAKRAWEGRTMGTLDHKAIRVQRAYRRYLWRRSRQPAEVTGIMDGVAVLATPKAIAAVAPRLEARLTRDGATLETTKCI